MTTERQEYAPSTATRARIDKDGDKWTLVLVRELRHSPEKVWAALTDPAQLREWAPYDADRNMGTTGATVKLKTVNAPAPHVTDITITRAEAPRLLEYTWGGDMRWELAPHGSGTKVTLWANIDRRYIAMGAAGWHVCFDVLERFMDGQPLGRMVGMEMMKVGAWQQLNAKYTKEFGLGGKE